MIKMKNLFFLIVFLFSSLPVFGNITEKKLQCSRVGTDVLLVNGISWEPEVVFFILHKQIEPSVKKSYLDGVAPASPNVLFKFSYNHTNGFLRDMIESAFQKISLNSKISINDAFVFAYHYTYKGVLTVDFISSVVDSFIANKQIKFKDISNYLDAYFSPNTLDKMVQDSFNINKNDSRDIKMQISKTLLQDKKLIIITESQGNLFAKQAIQDLKNGEKLTKPLGFPEIELQSMDFKDYENFVGQLQIATPTGPVLSKNQLVLNDKDIINLVFFEKPASNFNFTPPTNDPRVFLDRIANHFITSTYLNIEEVKTGDLPRLHEFTIQSLVNLAALLDSNCPQAVINHIPSNLQVSFDSIDPVNPKISGLLYSWDFGDGQQAVDITSKNITHNYAVSGKYKVTLTIKDKRNLNSKEVISAEIEINLSSARNTLVYYFANRDVMFGLEGPLVNSGLNLTYVWDFGDGNQAESPEFFIIHKYSNEGSYPVTLNVYDSNNNLLFIKTTVIVVDRIRATICADNIDILRKDFVSTTILGFSNQIDLDPNILGRCYIKSNGYFNNGNGQVCAYLFNCTKFNFLP